VAWQTFSHGELTIDTQFGDPTVLIVVGDVDARTSDTLLDAFGCADGVARSTRHRGEHRPRPIRR
jgi:hypothetical protein